MRTLSIRTMTIIHRQQLSTLPEGESHLTLNDGDLLQDSKVLNVMLFGADHRSQDVNGLSDTMIMLSIDNNHKKLKLTSFQRDTYVYIPDYGYRKLNALTLTADQSLPYRQLKQTSALRLTAMRWLISRAL